MVALPFFRYYKAGGVWLSLRSMQGRARGTREGERRPPLLFSHRASSTFLLSPPLPPKMAPATQSMIGYDEGNNSGTFTRVLKHGMNLSGTYQGLRR